MMILSDNKIKRVVRETTDQMTFSGDSLVDALGRYPTEDEARQFVQLFSAKLREALEEFEFLDPPDVPRVSYTQEWCDEHKGVGFRRPHGHVVYTVTGQVVDWCHGMMHTEVPLVRRSSDGKEVPMLIKELREMMNEG